MGIQLEDDLEPPSAERCADQLVAIAISPIPSYLEVLEEALDGFVKSHPMLKKLVTLEIVFEVSGRETMPVGQPFILLLSDPAYEMDASVSCPACSKYDP